ncbi:MAG: hypothetical protein GY913_27495 [Proteobacteria bacterium]|nr:hypothetical protein [Pseudomonadota bacterium]MCP4920661.1 hypothetical protein [Pseudomonadota bacterium]
MEKSKKLRRYSRKDYTQVVDFPVEIVGRDGVIRRYSFEASVRLYQRRIASASGRYPDHEVVVAEISHCKRRIEQLRRSYFHLYGWSGAASPDGSSALSGPFAGEVAAFLRRFFGHDQLAAVQISWLADGEHGATWFVQLAGDVGHVLYLYRFESFGACEGREAFFRDLRMLQNAVGHDMETLVAFHHTGDCGLVLSCQGEHARQVSRPELDHGPVMELDTHPDDPYAHGLRLLAEGESVASLERFEAAVSASPFRRQAIVAVCIVADLLARPDSAETAARIGVNNFPADAALRYHLGLSMVRKGELDAGLEHLGLALELAPGQPAATLLRAIVLAWQGASSAPAELARAAEVATESDGQQLAERIRRGLLARRALLATIPVTAVFAIAAGFLGSLVLASCAVVCASASVVLALTLRRALSNGDPTRLRLSPPESLGSRGPRLDDVVT